MPGRRTNPHATISPAEAERAIYIDCEGFQDHAPTLIGVLMNEQFEQIVVDPALQSAALAKGQSVSVLKVEVQRLKDLCASERRPLVAYSQHELNLFRTHAQVDVDDCYRNARMIAKR